MNDPVIVPVTQIHVWIEATCTVSLIKRDGYVRAIMTDELHIFGGIKAVFVTVGVVNKLVGNDPMLDGVFVKHQPDDRILQQNVVACLD